MLTQKNIRHISAAISKAVERPFTGQHCQQLAGGDVNTSYVVSDGTSRYFVKTHISHHRLMYQAECEALLELSQCTALKIPAVVTIGQSGEVAFLVLQYLDLAKTGDWRRLGQGLVQLHNITTTQFGWRSDNYIGLSPQTNTWKPTWSEFWRECRLLPQLELAYHNGYRRHLEKLASQALQQAEDLLANHQPRPSLVHGDLWSGNAAFTPDGTPAIFDPASYYGDREVDLAMTELFGGFAADFYQGYNERWPVPPGYEQRKKLYNLYHMLNHLNLFGGGYLSSCVALMDDLLKH